MYKLTSKNYAGMKCVLLVIASCCYYVYISNAAFPLEQDVKNIVTNSQPKRWIVFMERIGSKCLNDMKTKSPTSLMYILRCMIGKGMFKRCVMRLFRQPCILIQKYPNILEFVDLDNDFRQKFIQIFIHRQFNLNITMVRCNKPAVRGNGMGYHSIYFEIGEKKFRGPHQAVTVIIFQSTVRIKFNTGRSYSAVIEYDVVQNPNKTNHPQMRENVLYFPWGGSLVICFQIKVDVIARLSLRIITCTICNVIVYDGPNERLPIITKISNTRQARWLVGSTFQVYVVITNDISREKSNITYAPIYRKTSVFNLSKNKYHELIFDNHTYCYGHSFSARLCVYTYNTVNPEKIRVTLTDLNFTGRYQGSSFAAGVFVFNYFGETLVKLMQFNGNLPLLESTDFEIIGAKILVAIFVYSYFASLSLKFSMASTNCNVLLVTKDFISYSGYITPMDDTPYAFHVNRPSKGFSKCKRCTSCFRFQFLEFEHDMVINFPEDTQVMMTTNGFHSNGYHPCRTYIKATTGEYHVKNRNGKYLYRQRIVSSIKFLKVSDCFPNTYMQIQIEWLPCKLPCRYIDFERKCKIEKAPEMMWHDNDDGTCNICEKRYALCDLVFLKSNVSFSIGLHPKRCLSVDLSIGNRKLKGAPTMVLALNKYNMVSRIPGFTRLVYAWVSSNKCVMEIPKAVLHTDDRRMFQNRNNKLDGVKAAYWDDVLYHHLSSLRLVSWEKAARYCHDIGAFLLTIHSLAEYQFIQAAFLQSHDTSVLYVGLKREVMKAIIW